jgi:DNA-binding NarL/FixJ family response regulator
VLRIAVTDDGSGGAVPADSDGAGAGTGLRGLAQRAAAVDGTLTIDSPPGGPTRMLTDGGFKVAAAVPDAEELLRAVAEHQPDLAVIDVRMPPTHTDEGIRAALVIRRQYPHVALLVLSQCVEGSHATDLLSAAKSSVGYLLKDRVAHVGDFLDAVRRVAAGGTALDPEVVAQLLVRRHDDPIDRLTPRDLEVLRLMAEGRSNHGIQKSRARRPRTRIATRIAVATRGRCTRCGPFSGTPVTPGGRCGTGRTWTWSARRTPGWGTGRCSGAPTPPGRGTPTFARTRSCPASRPWGSFSVPRAAVAGSRAEHTPRSRLGRQS